MLHCCLEKTGPDLMEHVEVDEAQHAFCALKKKLYLKLLVVMTVLLNSEAQKFTETKILALVAKVWV